jgi:hypothetical protein
VCFALGERRGGLRLLIRPDEEGTDGEKSSFMVGVPQAGGERETREPRDPWTKTAKKSLDSPSVVRVQHHTQHSHSSRTTRRTHTNRAHNNTRRTAADARRLIDLTPTRCQDGAQPPRQKRSERRAQQGADMQWQHSGREPHERNSVASERSSVGGAARNHIQCLLRAGC